MYDILLSFLAETDVVSSMVLLSLVSLHKTFLQNIPAFFLLVLIKQSTFMWHFDE